VLPFTKNIRCFYAATYPLDAIGDIPSVTAQHRPNKGDVLAESRRIYIHYYHNIDKAAEDEKSFDKDLVALQCELESGKRIPEHENQYRKYLATKITPKRGTQITVKSEALMAAKRYYGYNRGERFGGMNNKVSVVHSLVYVDFESGLLKNWIPTGFIPILKNYNIIIHQQHSHHVIIYCCKQPELYG